MSLACFFAATARHDELRNKVQYRGNLTKALRYSVTNGSARSPIETQTGYDITGAPAFTKDALNRQTSIFNKETFVVHLLDGITVQTITDARGATTTYNGFVARILNLFFDRDESTNFEGVGHSEMSHSVQDRSFQ